MKILRLFVFGALAVAVASFAAPSSAKADSFGFSVGPGGFGVHVYDDGYYYGPRYRRGCWDPYYRAYVPCRYYYRDYPRVHGGYHYGRPHWRRGYWHRGRHGWRGHHRWNHRGWHGRRGHHRGRHRGRHH